MDVQTAAHFGAVRAVAFGPSGRHVVSLGEDDGCVFAWNAEDLSRATDSGVEASAGGCAVRAFAWAGGAFAFGGDGEALVEADARTGERISALIEAGAPVCAAAAAGDRVACAGGARVLLIERGERAPRAVDAADVRWLALSPRGEFVAAACARELRVWEWGSLEMVFRAALPTEVLPCWAGASTLLFQRAGWELSAVDVRSGGSVQTVTVGGGSDALACFCVGGAAFVAADEGREVSVYALDAAELSFTLIRRFSYDGEVITALDCDGSRICAGGADGNIYVWPVHEEKEMSGELEQSGAELQQREKPKESDGFGFLKDNPYFVETPKKVVKKAKSKGKQQLLEVVRDKSKPKPNRQFLMDDSESSSVEENANDEEIKDGESTLVGDAQNGFLSGNSDDDDVGEKDEDVKKSFLDEEASDHSDVNVEEFENYDVDIPSDEQSEPVQIGDEEILENEQPVNEEITTQFMPNSCDEMVNSSRILCWNGYGSMVLRFEDDGSQTIDITPSETSDFFSKRIEDLHNINVGTIDEYGYLFASKNNVLCHCHGIVGSNADISFELPTLETVELVATGSTWFAFSTSANRLYIFTNTGLPMNSIALESRCMTMVGCENYLFIVFGSNLHFELFDVSERKLISNGFLPVKSLKWVGFDYHTHSVLIEDSNFLIQTLNHDYGVRWTSVLDLKKYFKGNTKSFFIVNVEQHDLYGVKLTNNTKSPKIIPSSQLEEYHLEPLTFSYIQNKSILSLLNYQESRNKTAAAKSLDKELIVLFSNALNENKLLLATQIFKRLKSEKGKEIALRYTDQTGHSSLSERLIKILGNQDSESSDTDFDEDSPSPPPFERNENDEEEEEEDINEEEPAIIQQEDEEHSEVQKEVEESQEESETEQPIQSKSKSKKKKEGLQKTRNESNDKKRVPAISRIKKTNDISVLDMFGFSK